MQVKGTLIQGGGDTFTVQAIPTGLTADGKNGWRIKKLKAYWQNGYTVPAADYIAHCVLATIATVTQMDLIDEVARVGWGCQNTGGIAVAFGFDPIKETTLTEERVTVQPNLYIQAQSTATAISNRFYWEVEYDLVKLSDLEVLRLLAGGA